MEQDITQLIIEKYKKLGENPETHLKGLFHSKPINYWDYINTEALLSLQNSRTDYKDEEVFIIYNQITELLLKLILHEIKQVTGPHNHEEDFFIEKVTRANHYIHLLIDVFQSIKNTINYDEYNSFRFALAPASGFQSVQFRYIELHSTSIENLLVKEVKNLLSVNPEIEECFEHLYWKKAGINRSTKEKTYTLLQFEDKYQDELISLAKKLKGNTLEDKVLRLMSPSPLLIKKLKEFDNLFNIEWPLIHFNIATHYLSKKGESITSTGNSEWKSYLHPQSQQRRFFPSLWTPVEKRNWGLSELKMK